MGEKRPSIRTLPSGERARHLPPDELHPEGQLVLIRDGSPLLDRIKARHAENSRRVVLLGAARQRNLHRKRARLEAGQVPPEKRCV